MSAASQFKSFVERQQRSASSAEAVDWIKKRDEWLDHLQRLYSTIFEYLEDYVDNGAIELRESTVELNEDDIGLYLARRLTILIGAQQIVFTPIGTVLIGSKGRVDVEGSSGASRLVLVPKDIVDPRQMFRATVTAVSSGNHPTPLRPGEVSPSHEPIEWAWKIVSRPPTLQFIELNKETLFGMLMEVSGG